MSNVLKRLNNPCFVEKEASSTLDQNAVFSNRRGGCSKVFRHSSFSKRVLGRVNLSRGFRNRRYNARKVRVELFNAASLLLHCENCRKFAKESRQVESLDRNAKGNLFPSPSSRGDRAEKFRPVPVSRARNTHTHTHTHTQKHTRTYIEREVEIPFQLVMRFGFLIPRTLEFFEPGATFDSPRSSPLFIQLQPGKGRKKFRIPSGNLPSRSSCPAQRESFISAEAQQTREDHHQTVSRLFRVQPSSNYFHYNYKRRQAGSRPGESYILTFPGGRAGPDYRKLEQLMFIIPANGDAAPAPFASVFQPSRRFRRDERLFIVFNTAALNPLSAST